MRHTWRLIYGITLTGGTAGAGIIIVSVRDTDPSAAVAGLALLFVSLMAFRTTYELVSLQRTRAALGDEQRLVQAERGVVERDIERARREFADQERDHMTAISLERETLRRQIADERDRMLTEFANKRAELQRDAFRKGFEMGENGIGEEARSAEVIYLPFKGERAATIGTGTTHN